MSSETLISSGRVALGVLVLDEVLEGAVLMVVVVVVMLMLALVVAAGVVRSAAWNAASISSKSSADCAVAASASDRLPFLL
jgi:hypothetical protein